MQKDIAELLQDAEEDEEGLTNDVYFTDEYIIKRYSRYPLNSFLMSLTNVFSGFEYYSRKRRMSNEVKTKQLLEDSSFKVPKVIGQNEEFIVFENVEGESGFKYIDNCSEEKALEVGQKLSEFFKSIHAKDIALRDARLSNYPISENTICSIDHEYVDLQSNGFIFFFDYLTVLSSARQTDNYCAFKKGLNPRKASVFFSFLLSLDHAILLERNWSRFKKTLKSLKCDV